MISEKDRAIYSIRAKNERGFSVSEADVDKVRKAGWICDAITVCALFNFYNVWIDATGVSDMPALGYEMSGHRLATQEYARD